MNGIIKPIGIFSRKSEINHRIANLLGEFDDKIENKVD